MRVLFHLGINIIRSIRQDMEPGFKTTPLAAGVAMAGSLFRVAAGSLTTIFTAAPRQAVFAAARPRGVSAAAPRRAVSMVVAEAGVAVTAGAVGVEADMAAAGALAAAAGMEGDEVS